MTRSPSHSLAPLGRHLVAHTTGTQTGAILRAAFHLNEAGQLPRFTTRATISSDGFLQAGFVDRTGTGHMGAFIGHASDLSSNLFMLADELKLTPRERYALATTVKQWIETDYRSGPTNDFWNV